jgi:cytoskeletal protein CcmA (bactofilin family)
MWRKPDQKPSQVPNPANAPKPAEAPVATTPVSTSPAVPPPVTAVESTPVASTPIPAPAAVPSTPASAPVYTPAVTKVVAQDTATPTSIGSGLKIRGELSGTSDLFIDGDVQGKVSLTNSRVTVGSNGRVQADIDAREIVVEGNVHGNLAASQSIRLGSSSKVEGGVLTPRISIEDGARLRGKVEMSRAGETKSVNAKSTSSSNSAAAPAAYKTAAASTERE